MKRLQDELLGTLNEFSQREKDRKQQKDVLESTKRKLQLDKEKLEQDLKSLKSEKSELHASIQVLEDTIASKDDLAERMQNTQVETENQLHEQIQILNEDYKTALQTITDLSQYKKVLEQFDFAVSENLRQQQEETEEDSAADVQSSTCNSLLDTYIVQQSCNVFNSIMSSTPFSTEASLITANFPTLVDFCKRFVSGSAQLVEHALWMEQSWSRERNDLQNTTEEMKQTIRLLQSENDFLSTSNQEMEKESRKAKQVVEDTKNKLLLLEQKLKEVNEDFGELEASEQKTLDEKQELEQEVKELEKMVSATMKSQD
jgi:chromosome segregation ATPase